MDLETALSKYLTQLRADGRSDHTAGQYRRHVSLLGAWLRASGCSLAVEDVDHESLALFLTSPCARTRPDGKTKKATSANALRTSLRTFFRYCHEAGYVRSNPARLIRRALCGTPPPRALSDEEQGRLIQTLAQGIGPEARRDHALFAMMLGTGIRIGSALALDVRDVDLGCGELILRRTKGDVPTTLFLPRATRDHLRGWINGRADGPVFTGRNGRALSSRHVQRRLALWLVHAGIVQRASPHALRHSFASNLYRRTGDLFLVKEALRHRSIASTTIYAQVDAIRLRRVLAGGF